MDAEKPVTSIIQGVSFLFQVPILQKAKAEQEVRTLDAMRDHLKFWLEAGELVGYGNQVLPSPVRVPRKITFDFWRNAQIDRERETASDAARLYQRLLIIDPFDFPDSAFFPSPGPKYFGPQITQAMHELNLEITNFRTNELSHKQRAILIRDRVIRNDPSINLKVRGFDTATIRRHYKRFCNQPNLKA